MLPFVMRPVLELRQRLAILKGEEAKTSLGDIIAASSDDRLSHLPTHIVGMLIMMRHDKALRDCF
jgi:hypothetical protein